MLYQIIYACIQACKYRKKLTNYATERNLQIASVTALSPQKLLQDGIKCLIIDFDGVLAAYAKTQLPLEVQAWLMECCKVFDPKMIFILSNKPTFARRDQFAKNFPGVNFIIAKYKKPRPDSIFSILQTTKLLPHELLIIDDRLLTGILAAIISNIRGCLITNPFIDLAANPIQEQIFILVRAFELWLFRHIQR